MNEKINLAKFQPEKAKLIAKAKKYEGLKIIDINDKKGYEEVHKAQMDLRGERLEKDKFFDAINDDLNKKKKEVKEAREDVVGIIESVENKLKAEKKRIDDEKEEIKRKKEQEIQDKFNDRLNQLNAFNKIPENPLWLKDATDTEFNDYLVIAIKEFEEQEEINKKIKEEQDRINNCKTLEELELLGFPESIQEDIATYELFNQKKERLIFEKQQKELEEKQKVIDEQNRKLKEELEEKQKAIDEQNRKLKEEQDKIAKQKELDEIRKQEGERIKKQQEVERLQEAERVRKEKEAIEKRKKYQQYLDSIGYVEGPDFKTEKTDTHMIIYKKVGEFKYI